MDIVIRNTSAEPLYNQIYTQIRDQIVSGALKPGDALPSIRALAKDCLLYTSSGVHMRMSICAK